MIRPLRTAHRWIWTLLALLLPLLLYAALSARTEPMDGGWPAALGGSFDQPPAGSAP